MRQVFIVLTSLMMFASATLAESTQTKVKQALSLGSTEYLVQPGDVLRISVWKEQDLQSDVLIQPDGRFAFPLIGKVDARGKSAGQLTRELEKKISRFIADASVTVMVAQALGNKVFVIGQVKRPGEFMMTRNTDVLQSLSMAGGLAPFAKSSHIRIIRRRDSGEQVAFKFDYNDVMHGKKLKQNIVLRGGDVIIVP